MHNRPNNFDEQENYTDDLEVLKVALAEAKDLLAEYAIEMRRRAEGAGLRAEQLSEELGE